MNTKWLLSLLLIVLPSCMPSANSVMTDTHKESVDAALQMPISDPTTTGSLWAGNDTQIFTDPKAHKVGDLVTILVQEAASATRNLGTQKNKSSTRKTSLTSGLGFFNTVPKGNGEFDAQAGIDVSDAKTFAGSGSTNNSDTLTASITAVITKVYPNGNMQVVGRRQVTINHQPQALVLTGVIRPVDVTADNTITSSKVAQASVSYGSGGELATVAHEGWAAQTLDKIWPF